MNDMPDSRCWGDSLRFFLYIGEFYEAYSLVKPLLYVTPLF